MMLTPFSPPPGLNSDETTFAAQGQWADGNNVRFKAGKPQAVGSLQLAFTLPVAATCYDLFAFTRAGAGMIAYGQVGKLYVGTAANLATGTVPSDRTPAAAPTADNGWSMASWGDTLLAAIRGGKLYEQSGTSAATEVTAAPDRIDAGIISTTERQVLAFGCNEEASGTFNALCIRGCDIEDYNDWTSSATNNAFEHVLEGPGAIIAAVKIGAYIAVWTTSTIYLGQFIGDPSQTYRFDAVAKGVGPLSARSVAVLGDVAYWMGQDYQLRVWAPGAQVQVVPCPISRDFSENVTDPSTQTKSFIATNTAFQEIWFFYYDERDTPAPAGASRYIAYSLAESLPAQRPVWFRGILERTAMLDSEIVRAASSSANTSILGVEQSEEVKLHDLQGNNALTTTSIQSADFYLDESQRRMMIRGVLPDFEYQSGDVLSLTLFMRDRPQSTAVTKGPYTLSSEGTKKDFRASGKIAAVKLSTNGTIRWRLGKLLFDIIPMGER